MPIAFREQWPAVAAGIINSNDIQKRQLTVMRAETVGAANKIFWTNDGLEASTGWILWSTEVPPWVNVIVGDRISGGWSQFGRYGPIIAAPEGLSPGASGSDQDVYFWETVRGGGSHLTWQTTVYNAGLSADGTVRGHSRGRQFNAFAVSAPGFAIDV